MFWMRRFTPLVTLLVLGPVIQMLVLPPRLAAQDSRSREFVREGERKAASRAGLALEPDKESAPGKMRHIDAAKVWRTLEFANTLQDGGSGTATSQPTALPTGAGTISGMGESFSAQLSTGTASLGIPLALPAARGMVQPRLELAYSSGGGFGLAGQGWMVGAGAISRQTYKGLPSYDDRTQFHPEQDRFLFGGSELVPICVVSGASCPGAQVGEIMPVWASGWQYFRARIEGGYLRFFWSPSHLTWRVQAKDGSNFELGVPLDGTGYEGALQRNPDAPSEVFRWYIARQYDSQGEVNVALPRPVNVINYRYFTDGGVVYLSDIFDTSPAANPTTTDLTLYAHHTRLRYELRPDRATSYRTGWRTEHTLRLSGVDVTSKPFDGNNPTATARELVRRYHFSYDAASHTSLLVALIGEGRCATPVTEDADQRLPSTECPRLPPFEFTYQRVTSSLPPLRDSLGYAFEPFATKVEAFASSPPRSIGDRDVSLVDANNDGLSDVLVTDPGAFNGNHGIYFNASDGVLGFRNADTISVEPLRGVDATTLRTSNSNVASMDLDADGLVDMVHMPMLLNYEVFSLNAGQRGLKWVGRAVSLSGIGDPKINFAHDNPDMRSMDVNGDGLVDIVYTTPTEVQTFFALGRLPGGDGRFGHGFLTGAEGAQMTTEPVRMCAPWSARAVRFSDSDVRIADLNGDGLSDLARVRNGQLLYWPGRGNGYFGTGGRTDCPGGALGQDRHIEMANAPRFGVNYTGVIQLGDINGDGLADLIEVKSTAVDIYLNENGESFTDRQTIDGVPQLPARASYATLSDIDGSGTPDILWGRAHEYKYLDLTGGVTPYLLVKTSNGLGRTMHLTYRAATDLGREARAKGNPWRSQAPVATPVVVRSEIRDNLAVLKRQGGVYATEYSYRDPVFEGREREFRGFREATSRVVGDANSASANTHQVFLLGECNPDDLPNVTGSCDPQSRWRDNVREGLKGQVAIAETYDDRGVYISTSHQTYELRQLYTGLDGRRVTSVYPIRKDTYLYNTKTFDSKSTTTSLPGVEVRLSGAMRTEADTVVLRAEAAHLRSSSTVDAFGNTTETRQDGCIEGCPMGAADEVITAHSEVSLPADDASGWLWRERSSYITGSIHKEHRQELRHEVDARGNRLRSFATLRGTLPLARSHVEGAATAPMPVGQSGGIRDAVEVKTGENTYDSFGQIVRKKGPTGVCASSTNDAAYGHLIVSASSYVGTAGPDGCGQTVLTQQVRYDRGLAAPIEALDYNGQRARVTYDGFGRTASITPPHPTSPGALASQAAAIFTYDLPRDWRTRPYAITHSYVQDGADANGATYRESYAFVDGLGRPIASLAQADRQAGDGGDWVASGRVEFNAKGQQKRACDPYFFTGDVFSLPWTAPATTDCQTQDYDAFGRTSSTYRYDGLLQSLRRYSALKAEAYDAADLEVGPQQNTHTTIILDGHGREAIAAGRIRRGSGLETHEERVSYLPTGEPELIQQTGSQSTTIVRWLRYDSLGRLVLNVEPNTSPSFTTDVNAAADSVKAYRYAYNDANQLVGTSDARGCGSNYFYDAGGRLIAEDYSPCAAHHAPYTPPTLTTGAGTETFIRYDAPEPDGSGVVDGAGKPFAIDNTRFLGRAVSVSDRGSRTLLRYDLRGRSTGIAVRLAKPGRTASSLSDRYAPRWYTRETSFDAVDRPSKESTGVTTPELLGAGGKSEITYEYGRNGTVKRIGSSYGTLFSGARYLADGRVSDVTMGDAAATQRAFTYDTNHRLKTVQSFRSNLSMWTTAPSGTLYRPPVAGTDLTTQMLLEDYEYTYDRVGGITAISDHRDPADWPSTAQPVNREFDYDDFYRITEVRYLYPSGKNDWESPFAAENADTTRTQPSPHVSFAKRVIKQTFSYDYLGNMVASDDDSHAFWDRSTGTRTFGSSNAGPHQLKAASNRSSFSASPRKGDLDVSYDAVGQVTDLIVRRDGECLPTSASCWQRFRYDWDEIGNLARARRWDLPAGAERSDNAILTSALPEREADADLEYTYSGTNRVMKSSQEDGGIEKHALYIFATLEARGATWDEGSGDYKLDPTGLSVRLPGGPVTGRVVYAPDDMPTLTSGAQHLFLSFSDHLGSTTFSIDHATGELVEFTTYQAYGGVESDYRPGRWSSFREPYKFSGKEEDIEVGLMYFGARYYSPYAAIWMSPDPVTIHELGSDHNPYAYVGGSPIMNVDPDGRELCTLAVLGIIVAVSAIVAATTSVTIQATQRGGIDEVDWGLNGVAGAAIVGAVGGLVGGYAGIYVGAAAAWGAGASAGVAGAAGGAAGGALGGAAGYLTGVGIGDIHGSTHLSGLDLGRAVGLGALSGAISGGLGGIGSSMAEAGNAWGVALSLSGPMAGQGVSAGVGTAVSGRFDSLDFIVGLGATIAGQLATAGAVAASDSRESVAKPQTEVTIHTTRTVFLGDAVTFGTNGIPTQTEILNRTAEVSRQFGEKVVITGAEVMLLFFGPEAAAEYLVIRGMTHLAVRLGPRVLAILGRATKLAQGACFARGTVVLTSAGMRPIELIRTGDFVWARSEDGLEGWFPVEETFESEGKPVIEIRLSGSSEQQRLRLTAEHPLWSLDRGDWVAAGKLRLGERVDTLSGSFAVTGLQENPHTEPVFNLHVSRAHTYFVGDAGVWAHNTGWDSLASFKMSTWDALGKAEQAKALGLIDTFQRRFMAGTGDVLHSIRNVKNLGDGLWEIKGTGGNPVRVYIDNHGNVLGYSTKSGQSAIIERIKTLMRACN